MTKRYEVPIDLWKPVRDEIVQVLRLTARRRTLISYSALVARVTRFPLAHDSLALNEMLCEISEAEDTAGRGMLSVLVVHKQGDQLPGPGFFTLAAELGRDADDKPKLWSDELKLVYRANEKGR